MATRGFRSKRLLVSVFLSLVVLLILSGCGGGGAGSDDDAGSYGGGSQQEFYSSPETEGSSDAESARSEAEPASDVASTGAAYVTSQLPYDRFVIRTAVITLTVDDVSQGSIWLRGLATRKGGFVFSSNTYVQDESEFAQITLRVPADQLDSTIQELREHDLVIRVDSEETTSQDVSQEYVDNDARLEALEETQRRFLALLGEAKSVEEILRIESELTNIRSQIETIKGRQNYLSEMTSLSTVTVTLHVDETDVVEPAGEEDGFIARVFGDSWGKASGVIESLLTATITLALVGVVILPLAVVLYGASRWLYRRMVSEKAALSGSAESGQAG